MKPDGQYVGWQSDERGVLKKIGNRVTYNFKTPDDQPAEMTFNLDVMTTYTIV
jgi:hypothetical protein